ncbi:MAG: adenylate kinase family protein [Halobacteriales archaeon]|nr:adenylate kinase family protein [Halobacteriales archaeon]
MRVAVTGTPGTGKTTATERLETDLDVIHLNDVIEREGFIDREDADRDTAVVDMDAVDDWLAGRDEVVVDSHLAHHFEMDRVVVCRCQPAELEARLRARGEPAAKAKENAESEALDVILSEAVDRHGTEAVYEIDTTDRSIDTVTAAIEAVIEGRREPSAGTVSFVGYLEQ